MCVLTTVDTATDSGLRVLWQMNERCMMSAKLPTDHGEPTFCTYVCAVTTISLTVMVRCEQETRV